MGAISTEKVYLKLAVLEWISADKSCSEVFDLPESNAFRIARNTDAANAHRTGTVPVKNSVIFTAWLF